MIDREFMQLFEDTLVRVRSGNTVREGDIMRLNWMRDEIDSALEGKKSAAVIPDGSLCSGVAAVWCPVHGDCTCKREWHEFDCSEDPTCPLHALSSTHAEPMGDIH